MKKKGKDLSHPSESLFCVGVTGTNGKTTLSYMLEHIFSRFFKTAVIGTVDQHFGAKKWNSSLTTPGALELYERFSDFQKLGVEVVILEVSSHALVQKRTADVSFNALVFTHFSPDHLDYHGSMEKYFLAKQSLFNSFSSTFFSLSSAFSQGKSFHQPEEKKWKKDQKPEEIFIPSSFGELPIYAVLNRDDSYVRRLLISKGMQVVTYGQKQNKKNSVLFPSFSFRVLEQNLLSSYIEVESSKGEQLTFELPVPGLHNVYNALAAIAVACGVDISFSESIQILSGFPGTPGRLQYIKNDRGVHVFVDYAHTESALLSVLESVHNVKEGGENCGRILTVFGCGGNRDKRKRPIMTRMAFDKSDKVFCTSDNPRNEDPHQIIEDGLKGLNHINGDWTDKLCVEVDRKKAIFLALDEARKGDILLVLGKGHEKYQITAQGKKAFDDVEVVKSFFTSSALK